MSSTDEQKPLQHHSSNAYVCGTGHAVTFLEPNWEMCNYGNRSQDIPKFYGVDTGPKIVSRSFITSFQELVWFILTSSGAFQNGKIKMEQ